MGLKRFGHLLWRLLWREERWWPDPIFAGLGSGIGTWIAIRRGLLTGVGGALLIALLRYVLYYVFVRRHK